MPLIEMGPYRIRYASPTDPKTIVIERLHQGHWTRPSVVSVQTLAEAIAAVVRQCKEGEGEGK